MKRQITADTLRELPASKVNELFEALGPRKVEELKHDWNFWARDNQLAPEGDDWNTWFINAGRGFGKTRSGVEWVREQVKAGIKRIAAVASTNSDIERVMVKGESGFLSVCWKGDKTRRWAFLNGRQQREHSHGRMERKYSSSPQKSQSVFVVHSLN
jgi:phage terminase large subunit-like protein